jgi:hypothetical protein
MSYPPSRHMNFGTFCVRASPRTRITHLFGWTRKKMGLPGGGLLTMREIGHRSVTRVLPEVKQFDVKQRVASWLPVRIPVHSTGCLHGAACTPVLRSSAGHVRGKNPGQRLVRSSRFCRLHPAYFFFGYCLAYGELLGSAHSCGQPGFVLTQVLFLPPSPRPPGHRQRGHRERARFLSALICCF